VALANHCSFLLCLFCCCLVISSCQQTSAESYGEHVVIRQCWFEPEPDWPQTVCGILNVPEDYRKQQSRRIELPFIIFKAKRRQNMTVPLVVAGGGGPGYPLGISATDMESVETSVWTNWYYATIAAGRDLILIDNRGVGSAVPRLDCREIEDAAMNVLDEKLERNALKQLIRQSYTACKQRLIKQGINLSQYQVINAAKDLEQLRIGLGITRLNIYGGSYGSRLALVYERLYPGSVRTLILDSIFPQSIKTYENEPRRNYEAIMRIIDKCNRDKRCTRQFGTDLDKRLADFLGQLDIEPLNIRVISPVDDKPVDVKVTPQMFFDTLYMALYDAAVIGRIPKYLHAIIAGNRDYLAALIREYYIAEISVNSIDEGAYASYACFDEIPFVDFTIAREELAKYPFQHYSNESVFDHVEIMCEVWNVPAATADFRQTYKIDTPLLIYSGALDPVTPIELARPVIENARRWWAAVWPDISHSVMSYSECSDKTAAAFLHDPESDPFNHACAQEVDRTYFQDD
jgi:pimeloyl-ACP methyl ester carboxylesterase